MTIGLDTTIGVVTVVADQIPFTHTNSIDGLVAGSHGVTVGSGIGVVPQVGYVVVGRGT